MSNKKTRFESLKDAVFGIPKDTVEIKKTKVAVLGAVEQNYGIYQIPSFRDQVTVFWNDPLLKEATTMFSEQVVATGFFLTSNPDYTEVLNGKTALQVILDWCDENNIDTKLMEISIELKAFGNSLWRITDDGFVKIPIEAVWHAVRIAPDIPLQAKYNLQLVPIYGGFVLPWGQFIHFRVGVTGYHAPFGQGVIYGLLAKPLDSLGHVAPSIYDIRLGMRSSLHEGFRKFSFGNELWCFEGMSNEDFDAQKIGENIAEMSSTGNRIATNAKGEIHLAVPERTQSYDEFIKQMRDEFMMSLADPSLKLGLEQGFTKATSITASEVYKYKIATMRKTIKEQFEDLFKQILNNLGYDGKEAGIKMNFGPDETAEYNIVDIFSAVKMGIILKDEARHLLSTYHKWDIEGTVEGGDKPVEEKAKVIGSKPTTKEEPVKPTPKKKVESIPILEPIPMAPQAIMEIVELPEGIAGYNADFSKVYIDILVPEYMHKPIMAHEAFEYQAIRAGKSYVEAHKLATQYEKTICSNLSIDWEKYNKTYLELLPKIKARKSVGPLDLVKHE
jgi:hypothetical protein